MQITLSYIGILYLIVIFAIPLYTIANAKIFNKDYNKQFMNKQNTDTLRGIAVVVIFIHHLVRQFAENNVMKTIFINAGFLAVAIFLFVSGYAIMTQYQTKNDYLKGFFVNKVIKLFITFLLADIIVTILANLCYGKHYTLMQFAKNMLKFSFTDGRSLWFVTIIIYYYLIFYIAFKYIKNKTKSIFIIWMGTIIYIIFFAIIDKGTHWYNTAICFPLGMMLALYYKKIFKVLTKNYAINLFLSICIFLLSMYLFQGKGIERIQYILPIIFIWLIINILLKVELKGRIWSTMNTISFEFYLVHMYFMKNLLIANTKNSSFLVFLVFLLSLLTSFILQKLVKGIYYLGRVKIIGNRANEK